MKTKSKLIVGGVALAVVGAIVGAVTYEVNRRRRVKDYRLDDDEDFENEEPFKMDNPAYAEGEAIPCCEEDILSDAMDDVLDDEDIFEVPED